MPSGEGAAAGARFGKSLGQQPKSRQRRVSNAAFLRIAGLASRVLNQRGNAPDRAEDDEDEDVDGWLSTGLEQEWKGAASYVQ